MMMRGFRFRGTLVNGRVFLVRVVMRKAKLKWHK